MGSQRATERSLWSQQTYAAAKDKDERRTNEKGERNGGGEDEDGKRRGATLKDCLSRWWLVVVGGTTGQSFTCMYFNLSSSSGYLHDFWHPDRVLVPLPIAAVVLGISILLTNNVYDDAHRNNPVPVTINAEAFPPKSAGVRTGLLFWCPPVSFAIQVIRQRMSIVDRFLPQAVSYRSNVLRG